MLFCEIGHLVTMQASCAFLWKKKKIGNHVSSNLRSLCRIDFYCSRYRLLTDPLAATRVLYPNIEIERWWREDYDPIQSATAEDPPFRVWLGNSRLKPVQG